MHRILLSYGTGNSDRRVREKDERQNYNAFWFCFFFCTTSKSLMDMEKQKGDGLQGDCRPLLPWSWLLLTAFSVLIKMTNIISFTNISAAEWEKSFVFASLAHPAFEWCCATGKMLGSKELLSVPGNVLQGFKLIIKNPSSLIIILCTLASSSQFMWNVNEKNEARNFLSHMSVQQEKFASLRSSFLTVAAAVEHFTFYDWSAASVTLEIAHRESCLTLLQTRNEVAIFHFDSIRGCAASVKQQRASQFAHIRLHSLSWRVLINVNWNEFLGSRSSSSDFLSGHCL